jgi:hypothetical protein
MTVDVDDVNEKLNGLVTLLHDVGIDGVDPDALIEEQKRLASQKKDGASAGTGATLLSTDSQILEIIKKLQLAQADSPEILAALQSPELRALASLAAQKQNAAAPAPAAAPTLNDVMEDEDDNYPKIGPGYSDDISVMSDLTTPTVMTRQNIDEEELYKDVSGGPGSLPPMNIGGPAKPPMSIGGAGGGGKSRNKLGNVSAASARRAIAKTGGVAAQRRLQYQQQMAKLQDDEAAGGDANYSDDNYLKKNRAASPPRSHAKSDPSKFPSMSDERKKGKSKKKDSDKKKKKKSGDHGDDTKSKNSKGSKEKGDNIDWGTTEEAGWPSFDTAFGEDPFGTSSGNKGTTVDGDGFFASDVFANADPFAQNGSAASATGSKSSGSKKKKKEKRTSKDDGQGTKTRSTKSKDKKERSSRRASMEM